MEIYTEKQSTWQSEQNDKLLKLTSRLRALGSLFVILGSDADDAYRMAFLDPVDPRIRRRLEFDILTPGGAISLLPVESLYKRWSSTNDAGARGSRIFSGARHLYMGDSAQHMKFLYEKLDIDIPESFSCMPDHIALLCEFADLYARAQNFAALNVFLDEHFDWIEQYHSELIERKSLLNESEIQDERTYELKSAIDHAIFLLSEIESAVNAIAELSAQLAHSHIHACAV